MAELSENLFNLLIIYFIINKNLKLRNFELSPVGTRECARREIIRQVNFIENKPAARKPQLNEKEMRSSLL